MEYIQSSLFGRMSQVHSQVIEGVTFSLCLKKSDRLIFQCLLLGDGQEPEWLEAQNAESHGECLTLNFGASPSTVRESSLSQVLESGGVTYRYSLSPRACAGILRRAKERGKCLPKILEAVLIWQAQDES